jgi:hypothetical protein
MTDRDSAGDQTARFGPTQTAEPRGETDEGVAPNHRSGAEGVKDAASAEARELSSTVKEEAQAVGADVKHQAMQLLDETRVQLADQATTQRDQATRRLRSLSDELSAMADRSPEIGGLGSQLARQGGDLARRTAEYLEGKEPGDLVEDIRGFARRRPGVFLVGAAAAGVLVGRMSRGVIDARRNSDSGSGAHRADNATSSAGIAAMPPGTASADADLPREHAAPSVPRQSAVDIEAEGSTMTGRPR